MVKFVFLCFPVSVAGAPPDVGVGGAEVGARLAFLVLVVADEGAAVAHGTHIGTREITHVPPQPNNANENDFSCFGR